MAAGVVVWLGLRTDTLYLLTAAMLIAPFAGPAMLAAMGSARGDAPLFGKSLLRYGAGLLVTATITAVLTVVLHPHVVTTTMRNTSSIDEVAVALPLVAGAAGALNLSLSDRNSLVSGAAIGLLVAASLAPPTGVIGMAVAMGEWGLVNNAAYLLLLQLVGINISAAVVFRLCGLTPRGARFPRGRRPVRTVALGGMLAWQLTGPIELRRDSVEVRMRQDIQSVVQ